MKKDRTQQYHTDGDIEISVQEAGRRGGNSTLQRKGIEFYRQIGRKGGKKTAEIYKELFKHFGSMGGRPRRPSLTQNPGEKEYK
ncbi:stress-induced protein, KGG, repeat-containing protein [Chloroflexota bacterium]